MLTQYQGDGVGRCSSWYVLMSSLHFTILKPMIDDFTDHWLLNE